MAHKWIALPRNTPADLMCGPRRQCENCGAIQTKESKTNWGRVTGYFWWPKVGRCNKEKQP